MKWYQRTGWILVFLIFFFPVGCYLMWKYRPGWNKWVKWPLTAVFGLWFLIIAIASLAPASSPDSLTLSEAPETPLAPGESVTLKLQTAPAKFPLRGLSYIYDPAMIEVEKGAQDDEIVVTAKETPGTAAVCAQTSDGEAVSNIVLIDIEDPATAETAQAELDAKIQAAVDEALAESQALLAEKESELSEISGLLEETQDELEQTKAELEQTLDRVFRGKSRCRFSGTHPEAKGQSLPPPEPQGPPFCPSSARTWKPSARSTELKFSMISLSSSTRRIRNISFSFPSRD